LESGQSKSGTFPASQRPSSPPIRATNAEGSSTRAPGPAAAAHETPSHPRSHTRRADVLKADSPDQIPRDRSQAADRPGPAISAEWVPVSKGPVRVRQTPSAAGNPGCQPLAVVVSRRDLSLPYRAMVSIGG